MKQGTPRNLGHDTSSSHNFPVLTLTHHLKDSQALLGDNLPPSILKFAPCCLPQRPAKRTEQNTPFPFLPRQHRPSPSTPTPQATRCQPQAEQRSGLQGGNRKLLPRAILAAGAVHSPWHPPCTPCSSSLRGCLDAGARSLSCRHGQRWDFHESPSSRQAHKCSFPFLPFPF